MASISACTNIHAGRERTKRSMLQVSIAVALASLILVPLVAPAFAQFAGNSVVCQVVDVDGDGFKDLLFRVTDQIGGTPGVEITLKTTFGSVLLTSKTNGTGYCVFNNMPSGNYSWEVMVGASNITGFSSVPSEQRDSLSEEEAVVVQFLQLMWTGNSTEKTKAFYENFSRYVGYDLTAYPFPSSTGENLSTFTTHLFQWYQGLDDCIVNNITDIEVSQILQKIVCVSREICLRTLEISLNPVDLGNVTEVRIGLKGQAENASLVNYTMTYSYGNLTIENTILQVSTSNPKTVAAFSGVLVSSFDAFVEIPEFEDSIWKFEAQSSDLLVHVYEILDMAKNLYDSGYLDFILKFASELSSSMNGFAAILRDSMTAVGGFILGLMCYLEITYRFGGIDKILNSLLSGDLAAIALTLGFVAGFALGIVCVVLTAFGMGASAIPIIGYVISAIGFIVRGLLDRSDYMSWLDKVRGTVGTSLTQIMKVRQTLEEINTTQMMISAAAYQRAAGILRKFSYSSKAGNFSDYSTTLDTYGRKQENLAKAIDDAMPALDNLIKDFLFWNGPSGNIRAHLEGFESTWAKWTDHSGSVSLIYPAGIDHSSAYDFKTINVQDLDPSSSFKNFGDYDGWTDHPPKLTDYDGNQFSVTYDNSTGIFRYTPALDFPTGNTTNVRNNAGSLDVFYQYKFYFDSGTTTYWWPDIWNIFRWGLVRQEVITDWQNHLQSEYESQVLPRIESISRLVEQLSPDDNPPETNLSVSNIRTDAVAWVDLWLQRIHIGPSSIFELTSSDAKSGVAITSYKIFNATFSSGWITLACSNSTPVAFSMPPDLGNGEYKIEYNSTDCVGNVEAPKQFVGVPKAGWLFNTTVESPTYVFERADLDVSPKIYDAVVYAGSTLALNLTISEVTAFDSVDNVTLRASVLAGVDNETMPNGQWNFPVNYFAVSAGGQVNVTAILSLPTTTEVGNYVGAIEAAYDGKMQEVLINVTVLQAKPIGDINRDGTVNILDAILLSDAYSSQPGGPNWSPDADLNSDNIVDILDAIILSNHFLEHQP